MKRIGNPPKSPKCPKCGTKNWKWKKTGSYSGISTCRKCGHTIGAK